MAPFLGRGPAGLHIGPRRQRSWTVSYTHLFAEIVLSVFEMMGTVISFAADNWSWVEPIISVSYTHLDVYKRQDMFLAECKEHDPMETLLISTGTH